VLEHDGHGRLGVAVYPFVLMRNRSGLDIVHPAPLLAGERP
jgi:hypothetical protein